MQRSFILGDEWLYYKLYCGKRTADKILTNAIKPLTQSLVANKLIDQWFFLRYTDPKPHLRIRFHCDHISKLETIIIEVKKSIHIYTTNDLIWKVQTDTYQRELERYGKKTIDTSEKLFYIDSEICVSALHLIEDDNLLFLFALRSINNLFNAFNYTIKDKLAFVKSNVQTFKLEFNSDRQLCKQLNKKYQTLRSQIEEFITSQTHKEYQPLINLLNNKTDKLKEIVKDFKNKNEREICLNSLLSNHIHMMINRVFRDRQRLHELVCYDCLYRFYNFQLSKKTYS